MCICFSVSVCIDCVELCVREFLGFQFLAEAIKGTDWRWSVVDGGGESNVI